MSSHPLDCSVAHAPRPRSVFPPQASVRGPRGPRPPAGLSCLPSPAASSPPAPPCSGRPSPAVLPSAASPPTTYRNVSKSSSIWGEKSSTCGHPAQFLFFPTRTCILFPQNLNYDGYEPVLSRLSPCSRPELAPAGGSARGMSQFTVLVPQTERTGRLLGSPGSACLLRALKGSVS